MSAVAFAIADLKSDEGYANALPNGDCEAYPDPLSGGPPFTIGFGCTGDGIIPGTVWTRAFAEAELTRRVTALDHTLAGRLPWYPLLDEIRQAAILNVAFQIGVNGLMGFHKMLAALAHHDWNGAAAELMSSALAHQTPKRTERRAEQLRTGKR